MKTSTSEIGVDLTNTNLDYDENYIKNRTPYNGNVEMYFCEGEQFDNEPEINEIFTEPRDYLSDIDLYENLWFASSGIDDDIMDLFNDAEYKAKQYPNSEELVIKYDNIEDLNIGLHHLNHCYCEKITMIYRNILVLCHQYVDYNLTIFDTSREDKKTGYLVIGKGWPANEVFTHIKNYIDTGNE